MEKKILIAVLLVALPAFAADSQWILSQNTLTYHVSHPLHQSEGMSHAAKGKGVCHEVNAVSDRCARQSLTRGQQP